MRALFAPNPARLLLPRGNVFRLESRHSGGPASRYDLTSYAYASVVEVEAARNDAGKRFGIRPS